MVPITSTLTSLKTIITSTDIGDQARNRNGSSRQQTSGNIFLLAIIFTFII